MSKGFPQHMAMPITPNGRETQTRSEAFVDFWLLIVPSSSSSLTGSPRASLPLLIQSKRDAL